MAKENKHCKIQLKKSKPKQKATKEDLMELKAVLSQSIAEMRETQYMYERVANDLRIASTELRKFVTESRRDADEST